LKCLEAVEIESFGGEGHETDLLTLLFRCAPLMKRVTLKPHPKNLPSIRACKEICNLFSENPSVKGYAYDAFGKN
jgi:RimJ/RimL family protein N-acetyltransferase